MVLKPCQGQFEQIIKNEVFFTAVFKMNRQQGPAIAHVTLLKVTSQPGWEGTSGENGYMYLCG